LGKSPQRVFFTTVFTFFASEFYLDLRGSMIKMPTWKNGPFQASEKMLKSTILILGIPQVTISHHTASQWLIAIENGNFLLWI
jgi:hypothetical protein